MDDTEEISPLFMLTVAPIDRGHRAKRRPAGQLQTANRKPVTANPFTVSGSERGRYFPIPSMSRRNF